MNNSRAESFALVSVCASCISLGGCGRGCCTVALVVAVDDAVSHMFTRRLDLLSVTVAASLSHHAPSSLCYFPLLSRLQATTLARCHTITLSLYRTPVASHESTLSYSCTAIHGYTLTSVHHTITLKNSDPADRIDTPIPLSELDPHSATLRCSDHEPIPRPIKHTYTHPSQSQSHHT
jgi:hypothetical protein